MRDSRAWVVLLMVVVFLAGAAAGVLGTRMTEDAPPSGPFEDYALLLEQEFELPPERMDHLRVLLSAYAREVERVVKGHEAAYRAAIEPDLRPIHEEYDRLVRDYVLPQDQRARFDELASGINLNPIH